MFTEVFKLCYSHVYRGCREVAVLQSCLQRLYLWCATVMFTEVVFMVCYSHVYRGCEVDSHKGYCATVMFTEVVFMVCYSHVYRGI